MSATLSVSNLHTGGNSVVDIQIYHKSLNFILVSWNVYLNVLTSPELHEIRVKTIIWWIKDLWQMAFRKKVFQEKLYEDLMVFFTLNQLKHQKRSWNWSNRFYPHSTTASFLDCFVIVHTCAQIGCRVDWQPLKP